jgi:PAS domain S-box-containing protein
MRPFSTEKQLIVDVCSVVSLICAIVTTYVSINHGIYDVFPYFYIIPIVLIAYSRPRIGIYGTVAVGWIYIATVFYLGIPDLRLFTLSTVWFYIFVSLGVLISTYSQVYSKEGQRICGVYYNSQAGAFTFDSVTLKIRDANPRFSQIIRYNCDELLKLSLADIIRDQKERENFVSQVRDKRRIGDIEVMLSAGDGTGRWALLSAADCGEPIIVCTAVDITDHRHAQDALRQANRKLNLLNNVTRHDILNSLTSLIGNLQLSRQDTTDPVMLTYIAKEEIAAETIRSQILFTRDYQNIGVHSPQWQNVSETISLARATLDLRKVQVTVDIEPIEVYADPLLEKVFYNLIDNSIRHGDHVTAITIREKKTEEGLDLIIEDNGTGIPPDKKEKIFRREYFKNTGFGLFLSREILSITNLTIQETGTYGSGARFEIHAPRGKYRVATSTPQ